MKRFGKKEFVGYWESNETTSVYEICDFNIGDNEITLCSVTTF